jgi:predicted RNase H-like nuclease
VLFLGVDLAWGEVNRSGVAALDAAGRLVDAGWTTGLDETAAWADRVAAPDALLFVDAPLVVENPAGMRLCDRQTGQRYGRWWVSANAVNLASPRLAGVRLRERLCAAGWRYSDGREGPPAGGRVLAESYPYATLVGVPELGYDRRPAYKRAKRGTAAAQAWPVRVAACDELIRRIAALAAFDPPVDLTSHPLTKRLVAEPSPARWRDYKPREDLLDAVICAWAAAYWARHGTAKCQVLGLPDEPPARPCATIIVPARPEQRR